MGRWYPKTTLQKNVPQVENYQSQQLFMIGPNVKWCPRGRFRGGVWKVENTLLKLYTVKIVGLRCHVYMSYPKRFRTHSDFSNPHRQKLPPPQALKMFINFKN